MRSAASQVTTGRATVIQATTVQHALLKSGLLLTAWPWRASAYLISGVPIAVGTLLALLVLLGLGTATAVLLVGVALWCAAGLIGLPVAAVERRRLRLLSPKPLPNPHGQPGDVGVRAWLTHRYGEPATWREFAYAALSATLLWPLDLAVVGTGLVIPGALLTTPVWQAAAGDGEVKVLKLVGVTTPAGAWLAAPIGLLALAVGLYLITGYAAMRALLARCLLGPRDDTLARELVDVNQSRVRLIDSFDAERRRIERDLHDGAQQQLVALGMTIGLAAVAEPTEVGPLLTRAHEQARAALADLHDLIRGVHPQVLTDRGLAAAVSELADRSPVPAEVDIELSRRPSRLIETTAYFVVSEALANIAKHSGATRATVTARQSDDVLTLTVTDDGIGGAGGAGLLADSGVDLIAGPGGGPAAGSGLIGLADRVNAAGGTLTLTSPAGGPTRLHVELPCRR